MREAARIDTIEAIIANKRTVLQSQRTTPVPSSSNPAWRQSIRLQYEPHTHDDNDRFDPLLFVEIIEVPSSSSSNSYDDEDNNNNNNENMDRIANCIVPLSSSSSSASSLSSSLSMDTKEKQRLKMGWHPLKYTSPLVSTLTKPELHLRIFQQQQKQQQQEKDVDNVRVREKEIDKGKATRTSERARLYVTVLEARGFASRRVPSTAAPSTLSGTGMGGYKCLVTVDGVQKSTKVATISRPTHEKPSNVQ